MKARVPLALLWTLLGCLSESSTGTGVEGSPGGCKGANCGHTGATNVGGGSSSGSNRSSSSSASSRGGTSSATTATGGGSSGGTSAASSAGASSGASGGSAVCGDVPLPDGGGCPNGAFVSRILDLLTCEPIAGATVQALDANAVPLSGSVTSAADGTFVLCAPSGTAFTTYMTAPSYETTFYPEAGQGPSSPSPTSR